MRKVTPKAGLIIVAAAFALGLGSGYLAGLLAGHDAGYEDAMDSSYFSPPGP